MDRFTALETHYKGYRFRSRIEARWAVFYDALRIPYQYEPEGFETSVGPYLPDFFLPQQDCWVEIKGVRPTETEIERLGDVCTITGKMGFIFYDDLPFDPTTYDTDTAFAAWPGEAVGMYGGGDWYYRWCECPHCHALSIQFEGMIDRAGCGCPQLMNKTRTPNTPNLIAAYMTARAARFEHGETPRAR